MTEWYNEWVNLYKKPNVGLATLEKYTITGDRLAKSNLGQLQLTKITRKDIQQYMQDYGLTHRKRTVKTESNYIKSCLSDAVIDNYIPVSPYKRITLTSKDDQMTILELSNERNAKK